MLGVTDLTSKLLIAEEVARGAGQLAARRFNERDEILLQFKGPQDFLTQVDGEVEDMILSRLRTSFPMDSFIGEETGGDPGKTSWFIDPIDGTANFARGLPQFCISISCLVDNDIKLAVIYDPIRDELFSAECGKGAYLNGKAIQVSDTTEFSRSVFELGWSPRRSHADYLTLVRNVLDNGASFRRGGSGALALAYVADGRQDGYCELHMYPWDALAGLLLVKEAGGIVNSYEKSKNLLSGGLVIASNKHLHAAFLEVSGFGVHP